MQKEEEERLFALIGDFEAKAIDVSTYMKDSIGSYEAYETARLNLLSEPILHPVLPEWIVKNRNGSTFRMAMQSYSATYNGRRVFIKNSADELRSYIEGGVSQPVSLSFSEVKSAIKTASVESLWRKVQSRRENDPEGAITAARTLLEATIKHILDELGETYSEKDELPDLYKKVCTKLNLSPKEQEEQIFKQILQGVTSVVLGFSTLRNKYGDAHGSGKNYIGPSKRHADLVINLSGSMCAFLMETLEAYLESKRKNTL
jgi:hypothetical protein